MAFEASVITPTLTSVPIERLLEQKSYFPVPRWFTGDLVSVLDLDNSVRFSRDIRPRARKHSVGDLFRRRPSEIIATLGKIKQC